MTIETRNSKQSGRSISGLELWSLFGNPLVTFTDGSKEYIPPVSPRGISSAELTKILEFFRPDSHYAQVISSVSDWRNEIGAWYYGMKVAQEQAQQIIDSDLLIVQCNMDGIGDSFREIQVALMLAVQFPQKRVIAVTYHDGFDTNKSNTPSNLEIIQKRRGEWALDFDSDQEVTYIQLSPHVDKTQEFEEQRPTFHHHYKNRLDRLFVSGRHKRAFNKKSSLFPSGLANQGWYLFPRVIDYYHYFTLLENKQTFQSIQSQYPTHIDDHMSAYYRWALRWDNAVDLPKAPIFSGDCNQILLTPRGSNKQTVVIVYDAKEEGRDKLLTPQQWSVVIDGLINSNTVGHVIVLEGIEHPRDAKEIIGGLRSNRKNIIQTDATSASHNDGDLAANVTLARADKGSLRPALSLLSQADLILSVDTGFMHAADILGLPLVCLGGYRHQLDLGYYGPRHPNSTLLVGRNLVNSLSPQSIIDLALKRLKQ